MKTRIIITIWAVLFFSALDAQEPPRPFVEYPGPIDAYLTRIQKGKQKHAFNASSDFAQWQKHAREALIELTGLKQMEKDLVSFKPKVTIGTPKETQDSFTRALYSIETEPAIRVPFYILVPKDAINSQRHPLLLCPHGHDTLGLHSYAGAFKDEKHRQKVLGKEGDIGAQAARRGFIVIVPATRGLAKELLVPDPKNRHGIF